jgi:hypothetical protein
MAAMRIFEVMCDKFNTQRVRSSGNYAQIWILKLDFSLGSPHSLSFMHLKESKFTHFFLKPFVYL